MGPDAADGVSSSARMSLNLAWVRRRNIAITTVCWLAIAGALLWVLSQMIQAVLVLLFAGMLAYALYPPVERLKGWLPRWIPGWMALVAVYLALFSIIGVTGYFLARTAIQEAGALSQQVQKEVIPALLSWLRSMGLSPEQIAALQQHFQQNITDQLSNALPVLRAIFDGGLNTVLAVVLSIYLVVDGKRIKRWTTAHIPLRYQSHADTLLTSLRRVVRGYIQGQLAVATLIGVLVGVGMWGLQVQYPFLLGMFAFVLEFVPVIGVLVSGAVCVLVAFPTLGTVGVIEVLAYFVLVHMVEGYWIGPRLVGNAIGLHPAVTLVALIAGSARFGIWGTILAAPLAGLAQVVLTDLWTEWRAAHADEFPTEEAELDLLVVVASSPRRWRWPFGRSPQEPKS